MTHLCQDNCTYDNFAPAELHGGQVWDECPECGADISDLLLTYERVDEHVERTLPEESNSPSSPVAGCCAQAEQAEPLTEEQFDQIQRAIYDLQESHTEGPPEDDAEAGAQAALYRLKVLLAKAGADESMIPGDAEVALSIAEGEA